MIPTVGNAHKARLRIQLPRPRPRARTREVKLAVSVTQDKLDGQGYPVRNRDSSSYLATFEPAHVSADLAEPRASAAASGTCAS